MVGALLKPGSVPDIAISLAYELDAVFLSAEVAAELSAVFYRPKFAKYVTSERRSEVLGQIMRRSSMAFPIERVTDCRDPKDNKYLELALCVSADCIVSSDRDLLDLDPWRGIRVLTPADYLVWRG